MIVEAKHVKAPYTITITVHCISLASVYPYVYPYVVLYGFQINQPTISRMLKRYRDNPPPPEVIEVSLQSKSRIKRSRRVQYPGLDSVLHEWFLHLNTRYRYL